MKWITGLALGMSLASAEAQPLTAPDRIAMQLGQLMIQLQQQQDQIASLQKLVQDKDEKIKQLEAKQPSTQGSGAER